MSVRLPLSLGLAALGADQAVSWWVLDFHQEWAHSHPFFPWGVAPYNILAAVACLLLLALLTRASHYYAVGLSLLVAGLFSNALSYLFYGHFVDYLPTGVSYTNAADLVILVGCILLAVGLVSSSSSRRQT
ncbi:MAG: signal peptidase II [bacterium]